MTVDSALWVISASLFLGVLAAYLLDRAGLPPLVGFFLAGLLLGQATGVSLPPYVLELLLILVAFEVGRQVGYAGFSPAAIFAILIEAPITFGMALAVFHLMGLDLRMALITAVMLLSSSSVITLKLTSGMAEEARAVAASLTVIEDLVLFMALGLLLGDASPASVVARIAALVAVASAGAVAFRAMYRFLEGKEYGLPFALSTAFGYSLLVDSLGIATPFIGAFVAGYIFSRSGEAKQGAEVGALANLVFYSYMMAAGLSLPTAPVSLAVAAAVLAISLAAMAVRAVAVFLATYLVTGRPRLAAPVALATASVSELAPSVPILALNAQYIDDRSQVLALSMVPVVAMSLTPVLKRRGHALEELIASRVRELRGAVAYERLYGVLSRAFFAALQLALLAIGTALAAAYLGLLTLLLAPVMLYIARLLFRKIYDSLLLAVRDAGEARWLSFLALASTASIAIYIVAYAYLHVHFSLALALVVVVGAMTAVMYAIYRSVSGTGRPPDGSDAGPPA